MSNVEVYEGVLSGTPLFNLYELLMDSSIWYLSRGSNNGNRPGSFPGAIVFDGQTGSKHDTLHPYFVALYDAVSAMHRKRTGFELPSNILRIHLVAKNESSISETHIDHPDNECMSVVGFLTPEWDESWGGELTINDTKFPYTPGTFITFPSNAPHDGVGSLKSVPYWRLVVNYIVCGPRNVGG